MHLMNKTYGGGRTVFYSPSFFGREEACVKREQLTAKDVSEDELKEIIAEYGALVEDVIPLTEGQAWFFSNDDIISSKFCIQALFKVHGWIHPQKFQDHIDALMKTYDILRTAFWEGHRLRPLRVVLKVRTAEIRFHDLSNLPEAGINHTLENIMAASRRRGFSLEKDRLLRIGVFKTAHREYAVLIVQPQVVADSWDFGLVFSGLFDGEEAAGRIARKLNAKNFSFGEYLEKRGGQSKNPAAQYWKKLLRNLNGASKVPGYKEINLPYQQAVSAVFADAALTDAAWRMAKTDVGFIAILQAAWGIMLQQYNTANDAVYGVILSNRSAKLERIEEVAGIVNVMPVRVTCPINTTLEELVKKQQTQLMLSQPYSYCTRQELQEISGLSEPLFNHFLNFHSFRMKESYADVQAPLGVTPVDIASFDCPNAGLGIYFRILSKGLYIEFVYHRARFTKRQIELLQQGLLAVLRQIVQRPQMQVCEVKMPSLAQIEAADVDEESVRRERLEFLRGVPIFANVSEAALHELACSARSEYFVEGDVIFAEGAKQDNFYIVYSGNVEISRGASSGWSKSLKILKRGSALGYDGIFNRRASSVRAEALQGDVTMIAIQNETLCKVIHKNCDLAVNIIMELNEQVDRFQKLWIST